MIIGSFSFSTSLDLSRCPPSDADGRDTHPCPVELGRGLIESCRQLLSKGSGVRLSEKRRRVHDQ